MKPKGFSRALVLFVFVFFGLFSGSPASARSLPGEGIFFAVSPENSAGAERKIFALVNREREKKGLGDLQWQDDLARLARSHSEKMARENFFGHYDSDGSSVADRARALSIKNWNKIGENLFYCLNMNDYDGIAVQNWMKSAMHRRNILDGDYTATGIGLARSREGKIYVTQVFVKN